MKTERFAMAINSCCLYAFIRPESEQNCSLDQINGALAPCNARFFVRINWHGKTAQQSQLMHGSKGWKKQEPSVGERWVLGLRPRDSARIAQLRDGAFSPGPDCQFLVIATFEIKIGSACLHSLDRRA